MATFVEDQLRLDVSAHDAARQYDDACAAAKSDLDRTTSAATRKRDQAIADSDALLAREKSAANDERTRGRAAADAHRSSISGQVSTAQGAIRKAAHDNWISDVQASSFTRIDVASASTPSVLAAVERDARDVSQRLVESLQGNPSSGGGAIALGVFFGAAALLLFWASVSSGSGVGGAIGLICLGAAVIAFLVGAAQAGNLKLLKGNYGSLMTLRARIDRWHTEQLAALDARYNQQAAVAQHAHDARVQAHRADFDQALNAARATYNAAVNAADNQAGARFAVLQEEAADHIERMAIFAADWESALWQQWSPVRPDTPPWPQWLAGATGPSGLRIGALSTAIARRRLDLPAMAACPAGNILILSKGEAKQQAAAMVQAMVLRLLAYYKARRVLLTMIDPVELGQTFAGFMPLKEYNPELVTNRAWSQARDIDAQLALLTEQIGTVIQDHLQQRFATVEEYNAQGSLILPYRVLGVMDFPVNFSDSSAKSLVSIASNGPRCGVTSLIVVDTEKDMPYGFNLEDLKRSCQTILEWRDGRFVWTLPADYSSDTFTPAPAPPTPLVEHVVREVGDATKQNDDNLLPFARIAVPENEWWTGSTIEGLRVRIGSTGPSKWQYVELVSGDPRVHALVAGQVRSGKTNMLHDFIVNASLQYSPRELELYLVDLNQVGFAPYAAHRLPHARVIASESGREYGVSVLQGLVREMKVREDLFSGIRDQGDIFEQMALRKDIFDQPVILSPDDASHATYETITQFRQAHPEVWLPRIVLIVDEFQEFFRYDDPVAGLARLQLDQLVRLGGKFGIHVILASQTLMGAYTLPRDTIGQIAVRIAFRSSENDSRLILDDNPAAAHIPPSARGRGIYSPANGERGSENDFQSALLEPAVREEYLNEITALAGTRPNDVRSEEPIIFDGSEAADIHKNRELTQLLESPTWPAPARASKVWLGEPMAIKEPTVASIAPRSGSNLLIVTDDEQQGAALLLSSVISLGAQLDVRSAQFLVVDFSQADSDIAGNLAQLAQRMPHPTRSVRRKDMPAVLASAMDILRSRAEDNRLEMPYIFLVIHGLQSASELHQSSGYTAPTLDTASTPAEQFALLTRLGPDMGIHVVAWCNSNANVAKALDRPLLPEFNLRVVFAQPTIEDSNNLVESSAAYAGNLQRKRALLYDAGRLERFRPYTLISMNSWLPRAMELLRQKTS